MWSENKLLSNLDTRTASQQLSQNSEGLIMNRNDWMFLESHESGLSFKEHLQTEHKVWQQYTHVMNPLSKTTSLMWKELLTEGVSLL